MVRKGQTEDGEGHQAARVAMDGNPYFYPKTDHRGKKTYGLFIL